MLGQDGMPLQKGDDGYIPLKERGFAEQKAALLPLEDSLTGDKKVDEVTRKLINEIGEDQSQGSAGISFMPAEEKYPTSERGFYSGLQKTIDEKMPAKASPQQILSIVNNPQNAKPEEVKWSNLAGFLEGKQSVTKQEVLDYLQNEGSVKFEEVNRGGNTINRNKEAIARDIAKEVSEDEAKYAEFIDPEGADNYAELTPEQRLENTLQVGMNDFLEEAQERIDRQEMSSPAGETKYSKYVLPNGENYREVVLTMPVSDPRIKRMDELKKLPHTEENIAEYSRLSKETNGRSSVEYTSSHFPDIPNYVAHMRLNERPDAAGRDGLFIEEIQSDRHQQGREKGYKSDPEVLKKAQSELNAAESALQSLQKLAATTPLDTPMGEKLPEKLAQAQVRYQEARQAVNSLSGQVPDAPFRKDWSVQMFKRALRDAIASGKEWVGWTKGDTQAERYDLSKQVDSIEVIKSGDNKYHVTAYKNGKDVVNDPNVLQDKLPDMIGKELANKAIDQINSSKDPEMELANFSGVDLKVGGEGMKGFYDQILPKEIGKYVKKWGAKVEEGAVLERKAGSTWMAEYPDGRRGTVYTEEGAEMARERGAKVTPTETKETPIWKIDITPEMRESIQKGGQIAFMPKVAVVPERFTGTGAEETRRGKYVAPPKFFGQFNISQYEKGGKFFDAETGEDITDKSYENASISVDGGKPSLVANNESESMGTGPIVRSNLFKQKAGWKWISENPPETSTIVSVEGGGKHVYTLRADFQNGVKMSRYPEKTSEPRLRPTGRGELVMGQEIGRIDIRGKKHPVYDTITIGEKPASDIRFMPSSKLDEAHAKAIESGDMEEAQRMVDDAAKAKGLPIVTLWRGFRKKPNPEQLRTTAGRATTSYTPVEEVAKLYSHDPSTLKQGKGASVKKIYLDIKNPLDLREEGTKVSLGDIIENHTKWDLTGSDKPSGLDATDIVDILDELTLLHGKTNFEYEIDHSDDGFFKMQDFDDLKEYIEERANRIEEAAEKGEEDENAASEIFYALNDTTLDAFAIGDSSGLVYALQKNGYDGIIHKDTIEAGKNYFTKESVAGRPIEEVEGIDVDDDYSHDTYRPFNQNQIKSADPATYDDNGKLIPLSQRFDTSKQDIRFMPYSPELPKTEDGKVDWAGFKTRTQEVAKPLADLRPKSDGPEITEEGHIMPKTMDKPFAFTPQVAINFMPATEQVNLEDYLDRPIIALAADRMGIGQAYVGPTGAKQPLSMESQGGAGFSTLYRDEEHNPIWAFSKEQPALNFLKRINDVAEEYGVDSVLVAPTLLAPDNHLKNQTGQLGYVEAMEAALKAKMIKPSALNAQINEIIKRIAESESPKAKQATKRLEGISTFAEFADAVRNQSFNFADAEWIMKKAAQKKLPITAKELDQMGLLPSQIAKDLAHEGYYELPNFSVVSLFEVPKGQKPEKGMYHNAYPYIVRGRSIGYLKNIINLAEATKEPKVFTKKGQITAQPLMTVMPIIDQVLAKKALETLKAYTAPSK
jgi:hypothetical protein